jgi:hypothetical protein
MTATKANGADAPESTGRQHSPLNEYVREVTLPLAKVWILDDDGEEYRILVSPATIPPGSTAEHSVPPSVVDRLQAKARNVEMVRTITTPAWPAAPYDDRDAAVDRRRHTGGVPSDD